MSSSALSVRLWFLTALCFGIGTFGWNVFDDRTVASMFLVLGPIAALFCSIPALISLIVGIPPVNELFKTVRHKFMALMVLEFLITLVYGIAIGLIDTSFNNGDEASKQFLTTTALSTAGLFAFACCAVALSHKKLTAYFSENILSQTQINTYMESNYATEPLAHDNPKPSSANKTLIKGIITGVLILVLLIPTYFISDLVTERQERQQEIINEVSNSWAKDQLLSGPYLYIPLKNATQHIIVLSESMDVKGNIIPEDRQRSIYKVLLYKSVFDGKGNFSFKLPKDVDTAGLQLSEAKLCFGITDFKGIEDRIVIKFNNTDYELSPGLPTNDIDSNGLSVPVSLSEADLQNNIGFSYTMKIKGSGRLHFIPVAGNSSFALQSTWPNPSFDGTAIPNDHNVDESGFSAKWVFNKANLPFQTILHHGNTIKGKVDFGVSILQPVDDYAKTTRCIKYAIMFIGLTFSVFFIVEIMQKKPVHPVQYVLVGLALVIFYSLLLSISEFIHFDLAYLVASIATVLLISLYAKSHFKTWKIAGLFASVLGSLYAFNYVLISLEDTALLVGSVALFIILSVAMYASRKINWYGNETLDIKTEVA
jgi:inner membrane protein